MNFDGLFAGFANIRVAVVGDVMLDTYMWGHVERISPEAPVPVVALDKKEYRIGGAGNVALNTVALGTVTHVFSVTGNDEESKLLETLLQQHNIQAHLVRADDRITTNKTRIISRNQQMIRLDAEVTTDIAPSHEKALLQQFEQLLQNNKPHVVILEDYDKGVMTPALISSLIALCKKHQVITTVDPKRKHFFDYKGVDIFKPNLKEVKDALNIALEQVNVNTLQQVHEQLHAQLQHGISFITLSEKGIFYQQQQNQAIISTHIRSIADVSGAGDTVIAVASAVYAATANIHLAAQMANVAGGLVCEEVGTAAINKTRLLNECKLLLQ
jgi:rfaE bifunctional protein kinase chain/domain